MAKPSNKEWVDIWQDLAEWSTIKSRLSLTMWGAFFQPSVECEVCAKQNQNACMHWTLEVREPWALGNWTTGCPKKITLLKFIYNWTKNKKVLRQISTKHDTALSSAGQSVGAGAYKLSCFAYNFLKTLFNFGPIINEFQKSNILGHPVYAIHCGQSYFVTPPVTYV